MRDLLLPPRIALAGPAFSGKTSVAKALQAAHGYVLFSYTDYLKELAVTALQAVGWEGALLTINSDKNRYRTFLVALSETIGFDGQKYTRRYLERMRATPYLVEGSVSPTLTASGLPEKIVWDNVRYPEQYQVLEGLGFVLLRLTDITTEAQVKRSNLSLVELRKIAESRGEHPLPHVPLEVSVDATKPKEVVLRTAIERLSALWAAVRSAHNIPYDAAESARLAAEARMAKKGNPWTPVKPRNLPDA